MFPFKRKHELIIYYCTDGQPQLLLIIPNEQSSFWGGGINCCEFNLFSSGVLFSQEINWLEYNHLFFTQSACCKQEWSADVEQLYTRGRQVNRALKKKKKTHHFDDVTAHCRLRQCEQCVPWIVKCTFSRFMVSMHVKWSFSRSSSAKK